MNQKPRPTGVLIAALMDDARAAIAVAEPVIRERCARIALSYPTPVVPVIPAMIEEVKR